MAIGLIIIGDEILSGRRVDSHLPKLIKILSDRKMNLSWAQHVGDNPVRIVNVLRQTLSTDDIVFSCGGIGATPDDHTRRCAAEALGVPLVLHPEAKIKIQERICDMAKADGKELDLCSPENLHRLKMGEFPVGAQIIPNPYNKIPGFSITNFHNMGAHYFLPGFPVMAWPMMEWVLDTYYRDTIYQGAKEERAVIVWGQMESTLTPLMQLIEARFSGVSVFSLPSVGDAKTAHHIELGVKGEPGKLDLAFSLMLERLEALGARYEKI